MGFPEEEKNDEEGKHKPYISRNAERPLAKRIFNKLCNFGDIANKLIMQSFLLIGLRILILRGSKFHRLPWRSGKR
jgi:hypothetical protein